MHQGRADARSAIQFSPSPLVDVASGDRDRLFKLLVRWLITGNSDLGGYAQGILTTGERAIPFDTSTADLGLSASDHEFPAYKTLGWLFSNDVVAASILVACLRGEIR